MPNLLDGSVVAATAGPGLTNKRNMKRNDQAERIQGILIIGNEEAKNIRPSYE